MNHSLESIRGWIKSYFVPKYSRNVSATQMTTRSLSTKEKEGEMIASRSRDTATLVTNELVMVVLRENNQRDQA